MCFFLSTTGFDKYLERRNGIGDQEIKENLELEKTALDRRTWKDVVVDICLQGAKR
jgi:hypothetical protein